MNEVDIVERIKYLLGEKDISMAALAKTLDMSQTTVFRQLKGEQALSAKTVSRVLDCFPDVSAEWLMRGEGEWMCANENTNASSECLVKRYSMPEQGMDIAAEPTPYYNRVETDVIEWKAKYDELEKRYNQLVAVLSGNK